MQEQEAECNNLSRSHYVTMFSGEKSYGKVLAFNKEMYHIDKDKFAH